MANPTPEPSHNSNSHLTNLNDRLKIETMIITDNTKDLLLKSARKLFAIKGLEGTTVKDIAEDAGVNSSLVSYHFNGKEGLFEACIRSMGQTSLQMAKRVLTPAESKPELKLKLEIFVTEILTHHAENSDVTRIIHREMENNTPFMEEIFKSTFLEIFLTVQTFLIDAQKTGLIRSDLNPLVVSSILIGSIVQFGRMDIKCQRYFNHSIQDKEYLNSVTHHIVEMFLFGTLSKKEETL